MATAMATATARTTLVWVTLAQVRSAHLTLARDRWQPIGRLPDRDRR
jgi:hypothetical protein